MTSITVSSLHLGKPRHDTPPFSFPVGFRKSSVCMTSEGLLPPPWRLSEPSYPSASQESSSGSSAASGFVLRPASPAPLSRTFLRKVQLAKVWLSLPSHPHPFPGPRRAGGPQPSAPQGRAGRCCRGFSREGRQQRRSFVGSQPQKGRRDGQLSPGAPAFCATSKSPDAVHSEPREPPEPRCPELHAREHDPTAGQQ